MNIMDILSNNNIKQDTKIKAKITEGRIESDFNDFVLRFLCLVNSLSDEICHLNISEEEKNKLRDKLKEYASEVGDKINDKAKEVFSGEPDIKPSKPTSEIPSAINATEVSEIETSNQPQSMLPPPMISAFGY